MPLLVVQLPQGTAVRHEFPTIDSAVKRCSSEVNTGLSEEQEANATIEIFLYDPSEDEKVVQYNLLDHSLENTDW